MISLKPSLLKILALSSSRAGNSAYLEPARPLIQSLLGEAYCNIAFVPFASVDDNFEQYGQMVQDGLKDLGYNINTVLPGNAHQVISDADVIMVGGGNTFKLLHNVYAYNLYNVIVEKVKRGTPYIGWSAGANLAGLTIGTTNDMPIVQPESFRSFGFFPFLINPHYLNQVSSGFNGETRDQRLREFVMMNPGLRVVGLPEGSALILKDGALTYQATEQGYLFQCPKFGADFKMTLEPGELLEKIE